MFRKGKRLSSGLARSKQWTINEGRILELERGGSQKPLGPVMEQLCQTYNPQGRPTSCAPTAGRRSGHTQRYQESTSDESRIRHLKGDADALTNSSPPIVQRRYFVIARFIMSRCASRTQRKSSGHPQGQNRNRQHKSRWAILFDMVGEHPRDAPRACGN